VFTLRFDPELQQGYPSRHAVSLESYRGVGILLAIGAAQFGVVWLSVIGGALCIVFLVGFVRILRPR
jgi:hypothetical protein